ncbi:unnamed protein product [Rotaria sp. Silwood1]|nr:unnamed protein product [Rotaria sp. Silwood1]CAF1074981.1 unnamed protein product [Rotaria sp. Silwood1]CAF1081793.1 unnamed protein product [Rotaria sp. Silwood1]CAF3411036.1 unnamed protein product [Rotaria sp. Silwood1]CAF3440396.1 unnamed protein product [Rotaria sp. Silwood1]
MKSCYQNLFIILTYPSSYGNEQRAFLRCHLSPISCKRDLSDFEENQNPLSIINKNYFQACMSYNNPLWFCLHDLSQYTFEDKNPNN